MGNWKIQITRGGIIKQLTLTSEPFPSWPFADVGDVGQLGVLSTNQITIARNVASDSFFEYARKPSIKTDITRKKNEFALLYNNAVVISDAYANITPSSSGYKIIISGRARESIEALSANVQDLDLSTYDKQVSIDNVNADLITDPISAVGSLFAYSYFKNDKGTFERAPVAYSNLGFKVETLLEEILSQSGLSVTDSTLGEKLSSDEFKSLYFLMSDRVLPEEGKDITTECYDFTNNTNIIEYSEPSTIGNKIVIEIPFGDFDDTTYFDKIGTLPNMSVHSKLASSVTITATAQLIEDGDYDNLTRPQTFDIVRYGYDSGVFVEEERVALSINSILAQEASFENVGAYDYFKFEVGFFAFNEPAIDPLKFTCSFEFSATSSTVPAADDNSSELGYLFPVAINLPNLKQIDFIKFVAWKLGAQLDYDQRNKSIIFYDYAKLIDNYGNGNFIDITNKIVDVDSVQVDRNGSLSQINYLAFSNSNDISETVGRSKFLFDDENATAEKTVYKADFSFSNTALISGGLEILELSNITALRDDSGVLTGEYEFKEVGTRLCSIMSNPSQSPAQNYFTNNFASWSYTVDNYLDEYTEANEDFLEIQAKANLGFSDVLKMSDATNKMPIVLNYDERKNGINGVFILQKISKFTDRNSTTLMLKKLANTSLKTSSLITDLSNSDNYKLDSSGNVEEVYNLINNSTIGDLTQSDPALRFALSGAGVLVSPDGAKWMKSSTLPIELETFTFVSNYYSPVFSDYGINRFEAIISTLELNVGGFYFRFNKAVATQISLALIAYDSGIVAYRAEVTMSEANFNAIIAEKTLSYVLTKSLTDLRFKILDEYGSVVVSASVSMLNPITPSTLPMRIGTDAYGAIPQGSAISNLSFFANRLLSESEINKLIS